MFRKFSDIFNSNIGTSAGGNSTSGSPNVGGGNPTGGVLSPSKGEVLQPTPMRTSAPPSPMILQQAETERLQEGYDRVWATMAKSEVLYVKNTTSIAKLKQLWTDYINTKAENDKTVKLNKVLPHFIALWEAQKLDMKQQYGGGMSNAAMDVFGGNPKQFIFKVSKRLVNDLKLIVTNALSAFPRDQHSSREAHNSIATATYRYLSTPSGPGYGFELLYCVEILAETSQGCEIMSEANLPSNLVYCLDYLFSVPAGTLEVQKGLVEDKILNTLCLLSRHQRAIEELQKTNQFQVMFDMITRSCEKSHQFLRAKLGRFGHSLLDLMPPTITYIHSKKIIPKLLTDLNNYYSFTPETYVYLVKMIIKILSESSRKSILLLDDFAKSEGYPFLLESLFRIESSSLEKPALFDDLLESITSMSYVGYGNIQIPESSPVPYQSTIHNIREISNQTSLIKNEHAFFILERYFLKSTFEENRVKLLDKILSVYSSNLYNFILLQHVNTLTKFIQDFESLSNNLKYHVMKIVCFVVTVLNCVPFQELSTFSLLVGESPSLYTLEIIYQLITTLVNFEFRYKHIFREAGLLDILIKVISNISSKFEEIVTPDLEEIEANIIKIESFQILLDSLHLLISENPENLSLIRKSDIFNKLLVFLPYSFVRSKSLSILLQLIKYDTDPFQKDFEELIAVLTNSNKSNYSMRTDILNSIRKLFTISKYSRDSFREYGGFVAIISIFVNLESSFGPKQLLKLNRQEVDKEKIALIEAICRTTASALYDNALNRESFEQQIGYTTFSSCLVMTGVLSTEYSLTVVNFVFDMVTENLTGSDHINHQMIINNVDAFNIILDIIPNITSEESKLEIIKRINRMAEYGRLNQEALSKLSIPDWILNKFPTSLSNVNDPLQPLLLALIQTVGANCLSGSELRQFVKLLQPENSPEVLLKILSSMAKSPPMPPYFEFNLTKSPFGYIRVPVQEHQWPPTNGYTIMFWLYVERGIDGSNASIDLCSIYSEDKKSVVSLSLRSGLMNVCIVNNSKFVLEIPTFKFEEHKWYHIGIVHARRLLSGTDFKLFVNGFQKYVATKATYPAQVSSSHPLICDVGSSQKLETTDQIWRIGTFYLLEEVLSSKHINTIYFLGPNYASNFKGRFSPYQTYEIVNSRNLTAIQELEYGDQLGPLNLSKVSMQIDENRIMIGLCANNKIVKTNNSLKVINNDIINNILNDISHQQNPALSPKGKKSGKDQTIQIINQGDLTTKQRGLLVGSVEAFKRNKVADSIKKIGGMPISLLLLEKSNTSSTLFDSLGIIIGLIQYHPTNTHEMSIINGYELLSWVLQKKTHLITKDIIDLLFDFIGINGVLTGQRVDGTVANWNACKKIMMNYEIWNKTSAELQKYLIQGYNDLIINSNNQRKFNIDSLRKINIIQELFDILQDETVPEEVCLDAITVLYNIFSERLFEDDIRLISAYLITTLHGSPSTVEGGRRSRSTSIKKQTFEMVARNHRMVNQVFQMFLKIVTTTNETSAIYRKVSSYWSFFFIDETLPPLSVYLALKTVTCFFLMKYDYLSEFIKKSGFKFFEKILPSFSGYLEIYITLIYLLLGGDSKSLLSELSSPTTNINRSSIDFHELLELFKRFEKNFYCIEAAQLILVLIKRSYEDNYQLLLQNNTQISTKENDDFLTSLLSNMSVAPTTSSSPSLTSSSSTSPLTGSQSSVVPNMSNSASAIPTGGATNINSVLSKVGSFWSKVEEKTLEFAATVVDSDEQLSLSAKKKRSSISLNTSSSSGNLVDLGNALNAPKSSITPSSSSNNLTIYTSSNNVILSTFAIMDSASNLQHTMLTYLIYLFHENQQFQSECFGSGFIEYLVAILFPNNKLNLPPITTSSSTTSGCITDRVLDLVLKFLSQIILSAIRITSKAISIIEFVLESAPTNITDEEFVSYHTRILVDAMNLIESNMTKTEFFENERTHSNIVKFSQMLIDRIHCDIIMQSNKNILSRRVFVFMVKILEKVEADRPGLKSVQSLYKQLNRIILYLIQNAQDTDLSFVINHIINHNRIIFSDNNADPEFIYSLSYPLYKLLVASEQQEPVDQSCKLWKLLVSQRSPFAELVNATLILKISTGNKTYETIDLRSGGFDLLVSKPDAKDFKQWMYENLNQIHQVFDEIPKKTFSNLVLSEKKVTDSTLQNLKHRRKERLQKREKQDKKDLQFADQKQVHVNKRSVYFVHVERERRKKLAQLASESEKFNNIQWEQMRSQLTRERAVWGPPDSSTLDKWKLDLTEGPFRMRKKMEKNYKFYKDYPWVPESFDQQSGSLLPIPCSLDSEKYLHIVGTEQEYQLEPSYWNYDGLSNSSSTTTVENVNNQGNNSQNPAISVQSNNNTSSSSPTISSKSNEVTPRSSPVPFEQESPKILTSTEITVVTNSSSELFKMDDTSSVSSEQDTSTTPGSTITSSGINTTNPSTNEDEVYTSSNTHHHDEDIHAYIQLLDPYDQNFLKDEMKRDPKLPGVMWNCASVDGMDKIDGILIFCPVFMYIFDGYLKDESTGDISEVEEKVNTEWLQEGSALPIKKKIVHNYMKWSYDDIRDILKRRYLLRPVALEIFSTDGRNHLIALKDETSRDDVNQNLTQHISSSSGSAMSGGEASGISGSQTANDDHNEGVRERITSIWRKSPLTLKWQQGQISNFQYLMHLNTLAGRSYNDLTQYPVFPWVLSDYKSDYLDLDDPKVYRDLSRPMGALEEKRAEKFRERFECWDDQTPDERGHLVPKFHYGTHYSSAGIVLYYLIRLEPFTQHFLKLQGGRWDQADRLFSSIEEAWNNSLSSVVMELIPEFFYLPEFLSNKNKFNFGVNQTGHVIDDIILPPWAKGSTQEFIKLHRKALESDFVSEHLHEWIDLIFGYKQQGKAAEDALNVFYYLTYEGAVNIDNITDPVEKAATISQINNFGQTPKQLFDKPHPKRNTQLPSLPFYAKNLIGNFIKEINEPVGQIRLINDRANCMGFNKILLPPSFSKFLLWGLPDGSIRYSTGDKIKVLEDHHDGPLTCMTVTDDGHLGVSGGTDSLICVYNLKRFSLLKRMNGHTGPITCVAVSRPYSIIVSGSDDQTCIIWDLNKMTYVRTMKEFEAPISCIAINDTTGEIVACSGTTINVYTVNGDLLLTLKTSQIIHDQITSCIWSRGHEWLGENVFLTGHRDGKIKIWGIESRLLPSVDNDPLSALSFKNVIILRATFSNAQSHTTAITCIYLTNDQQKLYSGDIEGRVVVWSDNEQSQIKQRGWGLNNLLPLDKR